MRTIFVLLLIHLVLTSSWSQSTEARDTSYGFEYFIQIASLQTPFEKFTELKPLGIMFKIRHESKDLIRYQLGVYDSEEQALNVLRQVKGLGHLDAFLVKRQRYPFE